MTTKKRASNHIKMIEKKYGRDSGASSSEDIRIYLKQKGYPSLSKLISPNERKKGSEKK